MIDYQEQHEGSGIKPIPKSTPNLISGERQNPWFAIKCRVGKNCTVIYIMRLKYIAKIDIMGFFRNTRTIIDTVEISPEINSG